MTRGEEREGTLACGTPCRWRLRRSTASMCQPPTEVHKGWEVFKELQAELNLKWPHLFKTMLVIPVIVRVKKCREVQTGWGPEK
eukprot:1161310-Pelagomonas_calceolata.AAC.5